jgi:hypothetical protein
MHLGPVGSSSRTEDGQAGGLCGYLPNTIAVQVFLT